MLGYMQKNIILRPIKTGEARQVHRRPPSWNKKKMRSNMEVATHQNLKNNVILIVHQNF